MNLTIKTVNNLQPLSFLSWHFFLTEGVVPLYEFGFELGDPSLLSYPIEIRIDVARGRNVIRFVEFVSLLVEI